MKTSARSAAVRVAISAGLLAVLFGFVVDPREVLAQLRVAARQPALIGAAAALYCVLGTLVRGLRWQVLVVALGHAISARRTSELFLVGTFFSQFLPTGIGGDVIRALMVARDGLGRAHGASTVVVDRALGLLPQFALGLVALAVAREHATPAVTLTLVAAGVGGVAGLGVLLRIDAWSHLVERLPVVGRLWRRPGLARFLGSFASYDRRALLVSAGWGFVFAFLLIGTNAALGRALGIDQMRWLDWAIFVPLVALTTLLPSIGGWGVREVLYVGLLATVTPPVSRADATALSIMIGGLNLLVAAAGGILLGMGGTVGLPSFGRLMADARAEEQGGGRSPHGDAPNPNGPEM